MHDPMIVAHEVRYPWRHHFKSDYRAPLITIWHVDPEKDGTDDSCGWFKRSRHGDKAVLDKIVERFDFDWDRVFKSESGNVYFSGYFMPEDAGAGAPNMGVTAIALNLFFLAALEHFKGKRSREKASRFCQKHLFEIMLFSENPSDSLRDSIIRKWGTDTKRKARIRDMASCIYGWILRVDQRWYQHPRWHIHHWKIQIHPWQALRRWLLTRCCKCGKRFRWKESAYSNQYHSRPVKWFRGEPDCMHGSCSGASVDQKAA